MKKVVIVPTAQHHKSKADETISREMIGARRRGPCRISGQAEETCLLVEVEDDSRSKWATWLRFHSKVVGDMTR